MPEHRALDKLPSGTLYHYTSIGSLCNILETNELYSSHVLYLNDSSEIRYAISIFLEVMDQYLRDAYGEQKKCLLQLRDWASQPQKFTHNIFVTSFTESGNLLSQWQSYSQRQKGISIGLDSDHLLQAADSQWFSLTRCHYIEEDQKKIMEDTLRKIIITAEDIEGSSRRQPDSTYHDIFNSFENEILASAARIKHSAFSAEQEWRLISKVRRYYRDEELKFREADYRLVPYITFQLPISPGSPKNTIDLEHVFVGPSSEPSLAFRAGVITESGV